MLTKCHYSLLAFKLPEFRPNECGSEPLTGYVRPLQCIAVRCLSQDSTFAYGILICSLSAQQIFTVLKRSSSQQMILSLSCKPISFSMSEWCRYRNDLQREQARSGSHKTQQEAIRSSRHAGIGWLVGPQCRGLGTQMAKLSSASALRYLAHGA